MLTEVPALAAKSQGMLNPLIYGATNKMFRQAFYNCLPFKGLREILVKREEDSCRSPEQTGTGENSGPNNTVTAEVNHLFNSIDIFC